MQITKTYTPEEIRNIVRAHFLDSLSDEALFALKDDAKIYVMFNTDYDGELEEVKVAVDL